MPNYKRLTIANGTYFFTQVTYQRRNWLCSEIARQTLRTAINNVRQKYPFIIDALVLLPNHIHCIWTLPSGDSDYATRWRLIKTFVTKHCAKELEIDSQVSTSRQKRQEGNLWQRRFWEHLIRDDLDFANHCDYIHYNPVKHGLCKAAKEWPYSSFHRFVADGIYSEDWGVDIIPDIPNDVGYE
ncbi:REP-associated tyrosine transposase [Floridanema aerugineum]|uniref:Transposase n=1 Tax=Floridaenema aerugineum BLCC-F46 TaxID=3153654 RepID=A0ABV4XB37_9CYAN